jgi:NACalpha-BTF3-like transcription factor
MSRKNNDAFYCLVCKDETNRSVLCLGCEREEMSRQKKEPSSITEQQMWFIRNKTGASEILIQEAIKSVNSDCVWSIEELSCEEGKRVVAILLDQKENDE